MVMRKSIKKIYKFLLFLLLGILLLPVVISVALLLPSVQTVLVQKVTEKLSQTYQTEISVERVYVSPMGRVALKGVLVKDLHGDSLLFAEHIRSSIRKISLSQRKLSLRMVTFEQPLVQLERNDSIFNFAFLLAKRDTSQLELPWYIEAGGVEVMDGRVRYVTNDTATVLSKFNPSDIRIQNLSFLVKDLFLSPDSVSAQMEYLSFLEASGAKVSSCGFSFAKTKNRMSVDGFYLTSDHSSVVFDTLAVTYDSLAQVTAKPLDLQFKLLLKSAIFAPSDIGLFSQWADSIKAPVALSGRFSGSVANLKGDSVVLAFGNQTMIRTGFNVVGMPRFDDTFLFLDITDMSTNSVDLGLLLGSLPGSRVSALPETFKQLGTIEYKGNFTGFINDLVAYGKFNTRLGSIATDIGVKITDKVVFSGSLNTVGFDLGRMFNMREQIGKLTMRMTVNGSHASKRNYFAYLKGEIDSVTVRDYTIRNIHLNGLLANQRFDGQVEVNDPVGQLHFTGNIDYSQDIPNFNFFARLQKVKLGFFNINPAFANTDISLDVVSNFDGASVDDLTGFFRIDKALLEKNGKSFKVDSIVVSAHRDNNSKVLSFRSDLATAEVKGHYNFLHLSDDMQALAFGYLPALRPLTKKVALSGRNNFNFHIYANKLGQLVNFVDTSLFVAPGLMFEGRFNPQKSDFLLDGEMPLLRAGKVKAESMILNVNTNEQLAVSLHFENLSIWNKLDLKNFALQQIAGKNSMSTSLFWNNWEASTNSGAIFSNTVFSRTDSTLVTDIAINASQILVKDTVWNINPCALQLTNMGFSIDNFRIWHLNQQLTVNGTVKRNGNDGIYGYVRNINLAQVLSNVNLGGIVLGGMLDAEFKAQDLYIKPSVIGEISIDGFELNKQRLGRFVATSNWDLEQNALEIETVLSQNEHVKINGSCKYFIKDQVIDYNAIVDRCEIDFIDIWIKSIVQNVKGNASGQLSLAGKVDNPVLTARLKVNRATFDIGILKTSYSVTDSVIMEPKRIVMKNMQLRDRNNHRGTLNGYVSHNQFSNIAFDLSVNAQNMLVLDTKFKDNPLYYGTVYTTGFMRVAGNTGHIVFDIAAKSMPNTQFSIPVRNSSDVQSNTFISFSSANGSQSSTQVMGNTDYKVDLSGIEMNMDLEITPDAKVQIIFDERVGDVLKGAGRGDVQLKIDKYSNITMFGNYDIEEGDYLFSLQNVINKRFEIQEGGRLKWDGDPFNAILDITASYKLRTNLYDLMGASAGGSSYDADLKKRVPVNCNLYLTDRLSQPSIKFGIETPTLEQSQSALLREYIHSEEEMNRQVLSLLVLNRFYSPETQRTSEQIADRSATNPAKVTTTEMLSNQFSNWLSQINKDVDVDINYRPGDEISSQEIEVALSTQLFNDRVAISTNVGYEEQQASAKSNSVVGDFEMNVKLNPAGTIRAYGYTRTNNDIIYLSTAPNKQGVGLSFREEFSQWTDVFEKYWAILNGSERRRKKAAAVKSEGQ
jgi:hypothetical protein